MSWSVCNEQKLLKLSMDPTLVKRPCSFQYKHKTKLKMLANDITSLISQCVYYGAMTLSITTFRITKLPLC